MSLRVEAGGGSVTFEKSAAAGRPVPAALAPSDQGRAAHVKMPRHQAPKQESEPGWPYDTVNAEIVGVFRPADDVPLPGDIVEENQVLGHIEALRLRNPVRNPQRGAFVAQIVEDGQAVEFGEALFVIDHSEQASPESSDAAEAVEPPRI